jgi:glycosyltransferase involved in cell wall biosynthesis
MSTRPTVLILGPHREAVSGVSTHVNMLMGSSLARDYELIHFQVGSEGRRESPMKRLARFFLSPFQLAFTIAARGASVVHLNPSLNARAYWRDLTYLLVAKLCGARVVYQVHGGALTPDFLGPGAAARSFLRRTMRLPDTVVVLASKQLKAYRDFVPEQRVLLLPNGIDCSPYLGAERPVREAAEPLQLAYIGRLAREKGIYEMLQGLRLAKAHGTNARLVVAGNGPELESLKRYAEELRLTAEVTFTGPIFGEEKIRLLASSDVFVLPSYSEGLPYALLESMAAGTPVITTPVGAIPDVVKEREHGLFVPIRNAEAIARAIAALDGDRAALSAMSEACRSRAVAGYSLEKLATGFSRLYSELHCSKSAKSLARKS